MLYVQQPALFQELLNLGKIIKQETNQDVILKLLAPYISNPLVIATAVGYIALARADDRRVVQAAGGLDFCKENRIARTGICHGVIKRRGFCVDRKPERKR